MSIPSLPPGSGLIYITVTMGGNRLLILGSIFLALGCNYSEALDLPNGVVAICEGAPTDSSKPKDGCGGTAVMIGDNLAISLEEVVPTGATTVRVALPSGVMTSAAVLKRGPLTGAVLLRLDLPSGVTAQPVALADSNRVGEGDEVWTVGNSFGVIEQDGVAALSRGIVSGIYAIPAGSPAVRGRGGRVLSSYRGAVIETDAAVNDGNQGGALLDAQGRLLGLVSLGLARERRLGTAVPIHLIAADLDLSQTLIAPAKQDGEFTAAAAQVSPSVALIYLERPNGLGNPQGFPRPQPITEDTPIYQRERLEQAWDRYYHDQQVFYTDQPITAVVIDAKEGLLLTSASNLHGEASRGRLLSDGGDVDCELVAVNLPLDLALLRAAKALPLPAATLAEKPDLACGDPIGIIGRHRQGSGPTLTTGVISATTRRQKQSEFMLHQTDALANYGNLGGPVIDARGNVIGMATMLGPNEDWPWLINSGVALFVDTGSILKVLPQMKKGENQLTARTLGMGVGLEFDRGTNHLRINDVVAGTGAEAAGVQAGDVLLALDQKPVDNQTEVSRIVMRHGEGEKVEALIQRGSVQMTLSIELRVFP